MQRDILAEIQDTVFTNPVVLYMKGTKTVPMCGFSASVANILNNIGVEFLDINVLSDHDIREGIKSYANWPTIPQLYIKGEFIGGCDIVNDMHKSGALLSMLRDLKIIA